MLGRWGVEVDVGGEGRGSIWEGGNHSCGLLTRCARRWKDKSMEVVVWRVLRGSVQGESYRLGGNCVFRRLERPIGSKAFICSSEGPGPWREDDGSTSSESSVMPLKVEALRL